MRSGNLLNRLCNWIDWRNLPNRMSEEITKKREREEDETKNQKMKFSFDPIELGQKTVLENLKTPRYDQTGDYSKHFELLADYLLNNVVLLIKGDEYRLGEIEFYYTTTEESSSHKDPFTHQTKLQKTLGQWYFHQNPNGSYKSGTYKGLDFTIGDGDFAFGGVLIRTIQNLKNQSIIEGPCLVVNHILEKHGLKESKEFVEKFFKDENSILNKELCLVEKKGTKTKLYKSGRVGLTLKKSDSKVLRLEFLLKNYRFLIFPKEIKKGKHYLVISEYYASDKKGSTLSKIVQDLKIQQKTMDKYVQLFKNPKVPDSFFGKELSVDNLCEISSLLEKYF